ncbi:MAG TPA: GDSL-type esterase/lipase family protein [Vicinamibacterales bacterium]|nr:GDSL-type esterase/lipase family protein [Vicinamibacterales bacterium]
MKRICALAIALLATAACGANPPSGPTPPADGPSLSCPANISASSFGTEVAVTYPSATVSGGTPPVNVTCSLASGALFPAGQTTTVTCSAVDAQARRAQCTFNVTLTALKLNATKFMAFGDSMTEGVDGLASMRVGHLLADPAFAYPAQLQMMLHADYPAQEISVFNEGLGGEKVTDPLSYARFTAALQARRPEALLLLDGYNDLLNFGIDFANDVAFALRDFIRSAKSMGVQHVFLSTLTPPGPTGPRRIPIAVIQEANFFIQQIAAQEGATLVDNYKAFLGLEPLLITDGLHVNHAGAELVAKTFHDAIVAKLGEKPASASAR